MPPWWRKFSSKEAKKKANKEITFDPTSEEKSSSKSGVSLGRCGVTVLERVSASQAHAMSPSPSTQVSCCQSFAERSLAQPLPLPLPGIQLKSGGCPDSGIASPAKLGVGRTKPSLFFALPRPQSRPNFSDPRGAVDLAIAFVSSDSSTDSDDPSESCLVSPQASDCEYGKMSTMKSPTSVMYKDQYPIVTQEKLESSNPEFILLNNQIFPTSSKKERRSYIANLQIPHRAAFGNVPDGSIISPSRSPLRLFGPEQVVNKCFYAGKPYSDNIALVGSGHCSCPGSGYNSGNSSVTCDMLGQLFLQHSRCSPECSSIPSPRMTSPGPSSRIHSGAVTPRHSRAGGSAMGSPTSRLDDGKQQSHILPLPPITCHSAPVYSPPTTPVPRSPGRSENPSSPGPRWKKGRLLGRGTFGHVYLGFNRESGEMCAMKEVTLFSDDAKSKESAQQLGQEITLLSRLRHPNIVQYYGTETVGDKLYIYLEFVSGGSIYKLLQDYGMLGEIALRSYTQQILSGLAYLHGKNTAHRDIKGANILVDPNGRVKLADFGMAKHITGYSCPLSFKGSPYWMAPEVITNSSGCNLAVDIWSLGCTVLEMATAKPPWSQYEGVAALFKIGNSKELPAIPDHLSDDGKDFVRKCLQRNPSLRPTACQLLEHPFVRNTAPLERQVMSDPFDSTYTVLGAAKSLGIGEGMAAYQSRISTIGSVSSETHMPRNISCPVSPIGSPSLHSRSQQQMSGRLSPSPMSSPCTSASGSSTPLTGAIGAIPIQHMTKKPPCYGIGMVPRSPTHLYASPNTCYQGHSHVSHVSRDVVSSENISIWNHQDLYNGQSILADRVSQQLLSGHVKLEPSVDLTSEAEIP